MEKNKDNYHCFALWLPWVYWLVPLFYVISGIFLCHLHFILVLCHNYFYLKKACDRFALVVFWVLLSSVQYRCQVFCGWNSVLLTFVWTACENLLFLVESYFLCHNYDYVGHCPSQCFAAVINDLVQKVPLNFVFGHNANIIVGCFCPRNTSSL